MFSMLDFNRSRAFIDRVEKKGQLFLTSIRNENTMKILRESEKPDKGSKVFNVHNGKINEIVL